MEIAFEKKLHTARLALNEAIDIAVSLGDPEDIYRRAVINTAKRVLKNSVVIDYEDESDLL